MTVFRQENVDDYYDTGEELGRYQEGVAEARAVCVWGRGKGRAVNRCCLKPSISLALR